MYKGEFTEFWAYDEEVKEESEKSAEDKKD